LNTKLIEYLNYLNLSKAIKEIEEKIEAKKVDIEKFQSVSEDIGNEIDEMKKKLSAKNKEINDFRKKINSVEAKLLDKKLERHSILKNSKIELIELPMLRGSMDDISDEDHLPTQTQKTTPNETINSSSAVNTESLNSISTNDQNEMFEKEAHIKINYKKLDTDFLNVSKKKLFCLTEYYIYGLSF
jgi:structural maintenance of chromosome 1